MGVPDTLIGMDRFIFSLHAYKAMQRKRRRDSFVLKTYFPVGMSHKTICLHSQ